MNLYHISQNENNGYDTYSDAVVAAPDEEIARNMSPSSGEPVAGSIWQTIDSWASRPENVTVEFLGEAKPGTKQGVICASFHAG